MSLAHESNKLITHYAQNVYHTINAKYGKFIKITLEFKGISQQPSIFINGVEAIYFSIGKDSYGQMNACSTYGFKIVKAIDEDF